MTLTMVYKGYQISLRGDFGQVVGPDSSLVLFTYRIGNPELWQERGMRYVDVRVKADEEQDAEMQSIISALDAASRQNPMPLVDEITNEIAQANFVTDVLHEMIAIEIADNRALRLKLDRVVDVLRRAYNGVILGDWLNPTPSNDAAIRTWQDACEDVLDEIDSDPPITHQ